MASTPRPAVQRVTPPKGPYVLINKVVRRRLSSARPGRMGDKLLLLHLVGRTTGKAYDIPVSYRPAVGGAAGAAGPAPAGAAEPGTDGGERLLVLTSSGWKANLRGRPDVEITLRGVRRAATTELVEDPPAVAAVYRELIEAAGHRGAGRRMGIRISVDRTPTLEELEEAARRDRLALVYLTVGPVRG